MARLRSWGLLCFAVLALPGPPGAGAQGKGMRGAAGDGPGEMGGGSPRAAPLNRAHCYPGLGDRCASRGVGARRLRSSCRRKSSIRDIRQTSLEPGLRARRCWVQRGVRGGSGGRAARLCSASPFPKTALGLGMGGTCCSEHEVESVLEHLREGEHPRGVSVPHSPPPPMYHKTWGASLGEQLIP